MSYTSQLMGLEFQQFISAAVGLAHRDRGDPGLREPGKPTIGNFWVDVTRGTIYVLIPFAFLSGIVFVAQGGDRHVQRAGPHPQRAHGVRQTIAVGPYAFMESIKQLGTNGGGSLNANSAHPFENPTGLTNFLSIVLLLSIPFALTYTFGKMVGQLRQGVAVLA